MKIQLSLAVPTLLILICPLISTGQESQQLRELGQVKKAQVHILLTDGSGRDIGDGVIASFKSRTTGKDYAKEFHENRAAAVPYGSYDLKVYKTAFATAWRSVDVYAPDIWVLVGLRFGEELPAFPVAWHTLNGTMKKFSAELDPVYVRLVGLYSSYTADARVSLILDSRTFQFAGIIPNGRFVLLFFDGKGLLCTMPIEIPKDLNVEVDLAGGGCSR
jgi:hypothetical protein